MVVRFVRFNIFPFEPETVEREFRVGDLIHQIGSVPEHVCQDIYRHLFSSDAPSILPIRPPSLPPAPPALPMAATAAAAALSAADAPSNNSTNNNSNNRNVCRRYSPKLTAQQWIDLLRGYYQARYELRVQHNKHLSTENYCLEIGEGLRVTTLLRKWNASGLEALAQSELDVDHPVVLHCLDEFKKSMEIKAPRKKQSTTATTTAATAEKERQPIAVVVEPTTATATVTAANYHELDGKPDYDRTWAREMLEQLPVHGPLRVKKRDGTSMRIFHGTKTSENGTIKLSGTGGKEVWIHTVDELLAQYFVLAEGNDGSTTEELGAGDRESKRRRNE